jgi:multicomponent Na+:H+ antiporter subunit A
VLSDNIVTLFIFWELTSLSSYFLIGWDHERPAARAAALMALLVTGLGGLAMLAGLILMALAGGGHWEISQLLTQGDALRAHPWYLAILILILAGAFTKSAQFPFHFWLPAAMEAPAPVSTYLHSATMVKAGIYLMARLSPVLGGTEIWFTILTAAGAATILTAAWLTLSQTDLKRLLAYSTVGVLGLLTMLLGIGSVTAATAAAALLLAHALYKGALFLVSGIVDHETGERDATRLGGLRGALPLTFAAALLAGLSMAGLLPFLGFVAKEVLYDAVLHGGWRAALLTSIAVAGNVSFVLVAALTALRPFVGARQPTPKHPHEAPLAMTLGPLLLGVLGLLPVLWPGGAARALIGPAASAIMGNRIDAHLPLWHGPNAMVALTALTLALGVAVYFASPPLRSMAGYFAPIAALGPARWYAWALDGLNGFAYWQTRTLQSGSLRRYLRIVMIVTVLVVGIGIAHEGGLRLGAPRDGVKIWELATVVLIVAGAIGVLRARSRLVAVIMLGAVGYGVSMIFVFFSAPDLAVTQFSIETLSVILFILVLYRLPRFQTLTRPRSRLSDGVTACASGALITVLMLAAMAMTSETPLKDYFARYCLSGGKGHNIVNVILVDFRGFDTMGEITVLSVAAIGVFALLKLRLERDKDAAREEEKP